MTALNAFGLFAVAAMLVFYALEKRSPWFIFAFAVACALGSVYGFFARRVAVWRGGSCVVSGGAAPLVAGAYQIITSWPIESRDSVECSY
jgi:hypothetical protein